MKNQACLMMCWFTFIKSMMFDVANLTESLHDALAM